MAQYGLPIVDWNETNFAEGAGDGDGDHFDELDEGFGAGRGSGSGPDGVTTYWASVSNPSSALLSHDITSLTDPDANPHYIRSHGRKSVSGGRQLDFIITLWEAKTTSRASEDYVNIDEVWTTRTVPFDGSSITDYTDLQIEVDTSSVGGGPGRAFWESANEFECPSVVGGTAIKDMIGMGVVPFTR